MRRDRGSASLAVLGLVAVVATLMLGLGDLAVFLLARAKAQTAADAAALAAAAELVPGMGRNATTQARRLAAANGAELLDCSCEPQQKSATVEVAVSVRFAVIRALGVRRVLGRARADVDLKGLAPVN